MHNDVATKTQITNCSWCVHSWYSCDNYKSNFYNDLPILSSKHIYSCLKSQGVFHSIRTTFWPTTLFTSDIIVTITNPIFTINRPYYLLNISTPAWNHKVYSIRTRLWPMTLLHAIHVILNHNHRSVKFCNANLIILHLSYKNYVIMKSCPHEMQYT